MGSEISSAKAPGRFTPTPSVERTEVPSSGQTVSAAATDDMTFPAHNVTGEEIVDIRPYSDNLTDKFVPDGHRHFDGLLRPFIPFVDMNIGSADSRVADANQHVVDADRRFRNVFQPEAPFRPALDQCLHLALPSSY